MSRLLLLVALVLFSTPVLAGQPWFATSSGVPYHWDGGVVKWIYTSDDLSDDVSNQKAVEMVEDAFSIWANAGIQKPGTGKVKTVSLQPIKVGMLTEKITKDNFVEKAYADTSKPSVIVFDKDGSIMAKWCQYAGCNPEEVMAFTAETIKDPYSPVFSHGMTILNGPMVKKYGVEQFKASIVHEIGHLLGLDHSGLNDGWATERPDGAKPALVRGKESSIPTMYPVNLTEHGTSLHMDDVVAISTIYPNDNFAKEFCTITGKIIDAGGKGIQGLEVEAHSTDSDFGTNAVSVMSGSDFPVPTQNGQYYLRGIIPGKTYSVQFSSLPLFDSSGSAIGLFDSENGVAAPWLEKPPIKDPPEGICDPNVANCLVTASGGGTKTVSCGKGGQMIVMDTTTIHNFKIDPKYATAPVPTVKEYVPTGGGSSKGGCTLIR